MNRVLLPAALFVILLTTVAYAGSFDGTVVSVLKGDTVIVARGNDLLHVSIAGVACPELDQSFGWDARQFLCDRLLGEVVIVDAIGMNHDGYIVGVVKYGNLNIGLELIRAGMAWHNSRLYHDNGMASLEKMMRDGRIGLWVESNPIPPWVFKTSSRSIIPVMSKEVINIGNSDYGLIQHNLGYGFLEANWPRSGGIPSMTGGGPGSAAPGSSSPPGSTTFNGGSGAPGSSAPGSSPPGGGAPGSSSPGSAPPTSSAPGGAAPGSSAPGSLTP